MAVSDLEERLAGGDEPSIHQLFAGWTLHDYLSVYVGDLSKYPMVARKLPLMPSESVQRAWTGNVGFPVLKQGADFLQASADIFERVAGRPFSSAHILDYGAG
jgi:hypothetical protein